jgi:hypothetical protein
MAMLVAKFIVAASTVLGIEYSVQNTTGADIYVFDRVFQRASSGEPIVDPELAYRQFHEGTLFIEKAVQPVPDGMKVEITDVPYLVRLAPGETRTGRIALSKPVKEFGAYTDGPKDGSRHEVRRVRLRVGYISAAEIGAGQGVLWPNPQHGATDFAASYGLALELQKFVHADLGAPPAAITVSREP